LVAAAPTREVFATSSKLSWDPEPSVVNDVNLAGLVAGLTLTHDALHLGRPLYLREALAAHVVEADHVKVWQTVGKLRRRHGLVMTGEPREPGYRVEDWPWEARRARSTVSNSVEGGSAR
jgi:hypothetical protein